jgi:hypothetical protein
LAAGAVAFYWLIFSSGGVQSFFSNLSSWRTVGLLEGAGYLTFPIMGVAPAMGLLFLLYSFEKSGGQGRMLKAVAALLCLTTTLPILALGFRISLVPVLIQFLAAYHYRVRRVSTAKLAFLGLLAVGALLLYGVMREKFTADQTDQPQMQSLIFRDSGLEATERVILRLDSGDPQIGPWRGLVESLSIMVPRKIWPDKPEAVSMIFTDEFFWEFFINRGDPVDGLKSGVSPTFAAETLGVGGIKFLTCSALALGLLARVLREWRAREHHKLLGIFTYILLSSIFAIFAEAPQNNSNTFSMLLVLVAGVWLVAKARRRKASNLVEFSSTAALSS